ncbi:MAG: hypothetical protein EOO46_05245 [Flavobacterium sp.]|nr:MAG: hypothetical protein EOO46_05245 [Flavobacterium sp.]
MTSIITGDIINSRKLSSDIWMTALKELFGKIGKTPKDWEIYRGDEFQLEIQNPEEALLVAIRIKALLRSLKLDVRLSIGIGEKTYNAKKITESNGSAFVNSGEIFEVLKKEKTTLAIKSGNIDFDTQFNLMLRLSLSIINNWLPQSAEFVLTAIDNSSLSQEEIGQKLGINQAAVSRRQKRAQFDLIMETEKFYRQQIKKISL